MTDVAIVPMRWWHVDRVAALERRLFPEDAWSPEQFWHELAQPTRSYLVVTESDAVIGYAGIFLLPPDSDLQTIAIAADQQGRGLARRMLEDLVDRAHKAGCTQMMLEVREENERAIDLYRRMEFERVTTRANYYPDGSSALIMRRRLT